MRKQKPINMTFEDNNNNKAGADEYEVLPAAKTLNLPLGIRCMEVNVQEVDEAVREFTEKANNISSPSWKFPHVPLQKLDVTHVMNVFRSHEALSDNQLYMELMELLIDRLYYAIMTSYEFVNSLEATCNQKGPNSISKKKGKNGDWDPLEIEKKSMEDKTPKPFHTANIGMLVKQFSLKMMSLENIVLNNVHSSSKYFDVVKNSTANSSTTGDGGKKKSKNVVSFARHAQVQTEESATDLCDSCYIAQNILKFVAENLDNTLKSFNVTDSEISKVRLQLKKDALSITQRGAVLRWLEALRCDCDSISQCANVLLDVNLAYQGEVRALKEDIEIKQERHEKEISKSQHAVAEFMTKLAKEKETRVKFANLKDAANAKTMELEKCLQMKLKDCEKLNQERDAIQRSLNIAEEFNHQIKSNLVRQSLELEQSKKDYESLKDQNETLSKQVRNLSEELAKAGQEILPLRQAADYTKKVQYQNKQLESEVTRLKIALVKMEHEQAEKIKVQTEIKVRVLEEELKKTKHQVEMLTLYPDLNGPINTPLNNPTGSSCVDAMEMQIKSNHIRMDILRAQSDRLSNTVEKLRSHIKKKSGRENLPVIH